MEYARKMNTEHLKFEFDLNEFDTKLLPLHESLLRNDSELLQKAVVEYLAAKFKSMGGSANIAIKDQKVAVEWIPVSSTDHNRLFEFAVNLLSQGAYGQAEPILRALVAHSDEGGQVSLNLGMMLSDQNRLDEAIVNLRQSLSKNPNSANAWNALGVAYQRRKDNLFAVQALEKSHEIEPNNPYTLRNLAALLIESDPQRSLDFLRKAASLLPDDQRTNYGLALALLRKGDTSDADKALVKTIEIAPFTEIAELCKQERTKIAQSAMRERGGNLRMDVVMYILSALEVFARDGKQKMQSITFEIAMLGRNGFDINSPDKKYSLKALPGTFSGLELVSMMYAGIKQMTPSEDAGIDFSAEYAEALKLRGI